MQRTIVREGLDDVGPSVDVINIFWTESQFHKSCTVKKVCYEPWTQSQSDQIFCFLGKHSKPVATIILRKSLTLLGNYCKGVKLIHFSSEIIFGQLL